MRLFSLVVFLIATGTAVAHERYVSPDGKFEAYTTPNFSDGGGMKLFLRPVEWHIEGMLLAQNGRWIDAKWSPDSQFLAIINHPDGHIADVYVLGITTIDGCSPTVALLYHTPNVLTYDVHWDVVGWRTENREVVLKQEVRDQNAGTGATHTVVAKIGTEPLEFELPK